jgi:preprotein translocase subunit SecG
MFIVFSVLIVITSIFLILIVLVQNSKGGGLASNFAGSNQVMGVRKTTDFLEKATWYLAIAVVVFSLAASLTIPSNEIKKESKILDKVENAVDPSVIPPNMPVQEVNKTTTNPDEEKK